MAEWVERLAKLFPDSKEQGDMMAAVTMLDDYRRNMLWAMHDDEALKQALRKISGVKCSLRCSGPAWLKVQYWVPN